MRNWTFVNLFYYVKLFIVFVVICQIDCTAGKVSYRGHSVVRVWPNKQHHINVLNRIRDVHGNNGLEYFWAPSRLERQVDIRVSPQAKDVLLGQVRLHNMKHQVTVHDLQEAIENERSDRPRVFPDEVELAPGTFNLSIYHTYEEIMNWMDHLAETCGDLCSVESIGKSFEGRDLKLMKIGDSNGNKPIIWVDAGTHAREWIAPATAVHLISVLLSPDKMTEAGKPLLEEFTWYILPVANPDGYAYTWTTDRLWRKNRSRRPNSDCRGADPNRNWDFHWGGPGTSAEPCSENYRGTKPFSEPEAAAISKKILEICDRAVLYMTLHSYGQYWLTPWGFTYDVPEDYDEMVAMGKLAINAMQSAAPNSLFGSNISQYKVGSSSRLLYLASGGSDDWVKGVAGIKYSYTVELRDTGAHGFILPANNIPSTGSEIYSALQTMATEMFTQRQKIKKKFDENFASN